MDDDYKSESVRFLERDFNATFNQMRHYDVMAWDIVKFSFVQLLIAIAASWTIYTFAAAEDSPSIVKNKWPLIVVAVLGVSYLFSLLAIFMLVRIRTYFVVAARYINEQRAFFLSGMPLGFQNLSGFYTDFRNPKAYNLLSSQMIASYTITLVASLMLLIAVGLLTFYLQGEDWVIALASTITGVLSFIVITYTAAVYLSSKDDKGADEAVFGTSLGAAAPEEAVGTRRD